MTAARWGALGLTVALLISGCSSFPKSDGASTAPTSSASAVESPTATPTATPTEDARFAVARSDLRASTVELVQRSSPIGLWRQVCTGNKVRFEGRDYVLAARHCITGLLVGPSVFPSLDDGADRLEAKDLHRGIDVTSRLGRELGVRMVRGGEADSSETVRVRRVAVRFYPDLALLSTEPSKRFDALRSLAVGPELALGLEDSPAYAAGLPAAADGRLVTEQGTYLGRVQDPSDPAQLLDLVGIKPSSPAKDACNYGASGSLGLISPTFITGPLAVRNNVVNKRGSNGDDDPRVDRKNRVSFTEQLDRSVKGYSTICGYAELNREALRSLVDAD